MSDTTSVGISFGNEHVRIVELGRRQRPEQVRRVIEIPVVQPFRLASLLDASVRDEWRRNIREPLSELSAPVSASVAIPTSFCHVRVVPVDADLNEEELARQAEWEMHHSVLDPSAAYAFGMERFVAGSGGTDTTVLVAVREGVVSAIRQLLGHPNLRLVALEADLFAAQRAYEHTHEADELRLTLLLGWKERQVQGAFLRGKSLVQYFAVVIPEERIEGEVSAQAQFVTESVNSVARAHDVVSSLEGLSAIYLYGDVPDEEFIDALRDTCEARVERLNPFHGLQLSPEVANDPAVQTRPESFAASVGAALW